jgi:hypothetical protein
MSESSALRKCETSGKHYYIQRPQSWTNCPGQIAELTPLKKFLISPVRPDFEADGQSAIPAGLFSLQINIKNAS